MYTPIAIKPSPNTFLAVTTKFENITSYNNVKQIPTEHHNVYAKLRENFSSDFGKR